ncbi:MAG: undecaprenyl-diphosphate phosphatase [Treponema sp.]|jgi:undecaprenyl-diphosphatase|nr:undecaprenyl-diphosphate phosphatase [Treponema sp.]
MSVLEALILGIVQGITEFLPVSSSGHLVLLQRVFGITEPAMAFNAAVHGGTLLAVVAVLWRDIWNIVRRIIQPLTFYVILGTIPTVIAALLFRDLIEQAFATGVTLGFAFLVTSALLIFSDKIYRKGDKPGGLPAKLDNPTQPRFANEMNWKDVLLIGLFQAVAIIPGISRSGATISAALSRRIDRDFAARFSFLLSIPAIIGALVLHIGDFAHVGAPGDAYNAIGLLPILVGSISACIVGFFSVRFTIKMVRERSLVGFAVYTGILGTLVLIDQFVTNFVFLT